MRDRIFAREAEEPEVPDVCGATIDLINSDVSPVIGISIATIFIEPGASSRPHYHKAMEEIYYFLEGRGKVIVGGESFDVSPGATVFIPVGRTHQVTNEGAVRLKFLSADAPSFNAQDIFFD